VCAVFELQLQTATGLPLEPLKGNKELDGAGVKYFSWLGVSLASAIALALDRLRWLVFVSLVIPTSLYAEDQIHLKVAENLQTGVATQTEQAPGSKPLTRKPEIELSNFSKGKQAIFTRSCSASIDKHCGVGEDTLQCLFENQDKLDFCCLSELHELHDLPFSSTEEFKHNKTVFPAGSTFEYDNYCRYLTAVTERSVQYDDLEIEPGTIVFKETGHLGAAQLSGEQTIQGLNLAEEQPWVLFHNDDTPTHVRLSEPSLKDGIKFGPMGDDEKRFTNGLEYPRIPTKYLHQLLIQLKESPSKPVYDSGTTMLHSNGRIARGKVLENTVVNGVPIAPGITFFSKDGSVIKGKLSGQYRYKQFLLAAGEVTFTDDGVLLSAVLAQGAMLNKWKIDSEARISMDNQGVPYRIVFLQQQGSQNHLRHVTAGSLKIGTGQSYKLYPNGQIKELLLGDHSWYQGKPYPANTTMIFDKEGDVTWAEFYDDILKQAKQSGNTKNIPDVLPTAEVRRGFLLPAGSLVYPVERGGYQKMVVPTPFTYRGLRIQAGEFGIDYDNNIRDAYFDGDQTLYGITFKGYPSQVQLTALGDIAEGQLAYDQVVDGVLVESAPSRVQFGKNGRLAFAELSGAQMVNGVLIKGSPSRTSFDDGNLLEATLAQVTTLDGIHYAGSSTIKFGENMRVRYGRLAVHTKINDFWYKKGAGIWFDSNGNFNRSVLASNTTFQGIELPADSEIKWFNNGLQISSSEQIIVRGITFEGKELHIENDGGIGRGLLSNNTTVNGTELQAGTVVKINVAGELLGHQFVGLYRESAPVAALGEDLSKTRDPESERAECIQSMDWAMEDQGYWLRGLLIRKCVKIVAR